MTSFKIQTVSPFTLIIYVTSICCHSISPFLFRLSISPLYVVILFRLSNFAFLISPCQIRLFISPFYFALQFRLLISPFYFVLQFPPFIISPLNFAILFSRFYFVFYFNFQIQTRFRLSISFLYSNIFSIVFTLGCLYHLTTLHSSHETLKLSWDLLTLSQCSHWTFLGSHKALMRPNPWDPPMGTFCCACATLSHKQNIS